MHGAVWITKEILWVAIPVVYVASTLLLYIGLRPMWRFHSYFEPAGEAQGIKTAVEPTTEGVNVYRQGYE